MKKFFLLISLLIAFPSIAQVTEVQTGELISASKINELVNKVNSLTEELALIKSGRYLIRKHSSGNNWHNIYSDCWVSQGGFLDAPDSTQNITFAVTMANLSFDAQATWVGSNSATMNYSNAGFTSINASGFSATVNNSAGLRKKWRVEGLGLKTSIQALGVNVSGCL